MFELYRFYFKTLCELHPDLHHLDTDRVFEVIHIEEAFGDFRKLVQEKGFIFRLIYPTYSFSNQGSDGHRQMQCAFLLAKSYSNRKEGKAGFFTALEACRKVADDFVVKILEDSRQGYPLFAYSANKPGELNWNAQVHNPTGDATYTGLLCTFQLSEPFPVCLSDHANDTWREPTPVPPSFYLTAAGDYFLTASGDKLILS